MEFNNCNKKLIIFKIFLNSVLISIIVTVLFGLLIGFRPILIIGNSMSPAVNYGDLIVIRKVSIEYIHTGDIISYQRGANTQVVTHRVVDVEDDIIITRGESLNSSNDDPISYDMVLGKVIYVLVITGKIVNFFRNYLNFINVVLLICIWMIIYKELKQKIFRQYLYL